MRCFLETIIFLQETMYKRHIKRIVDFSGALILLLTLWPVLGLLMVLLSLYYRGSPFFIQERTGLHNKTFRLYKFKSMKDAIGSDGRLLPDEERLTAVGAILRKSSLDELPQLINVLKGEMSFIGPRPLFVRYLPFYTKRELLRHTVRPGITGLAQVSGRNALRWNDRLELDVQYVERMSAKLDLEIFWKTITKVLSRKEIVVIPGTLYSPLDVERSSHGNQSNPIQ